MFGNLFKSQGQQAPGQQPQGQQFNQQNPNPGMNPQGSPQGWAPGDQSQVNQNGQQQMPPQQTPQRSPLDEMTELLQNTGKQAGDGSSFFDIQPDQLNKITAGADFFSGMDPQLMQGMDPNQVKLMNTAMQKMMSQMLPMMVGLTKAGGEHFSKQLETTLPQRMNAETATHQFLQTNPAAKPLANMLIPALQQKNPGKSPQEISAMAEQYFGSLVDAAVQHRSQTQQQGNGSVPGNNRQGGTDWENFF